MNLQDGEVVLPVPGFEAFYLVSNYGRVFSKNYRMTGRTEELAQSSLRDNLRHAEATGLAKHVAGEDHGCASISNEKARAVYVECAAAPKRKGALIAIALRHGVTRDVVYSIASGRNWGCVRD